MRQTPYVVLTWLSCAKRYDCCSMGKWCELRRVCVLFSAGGRGPRQRAAVYALWRPVPRLPCPWLEVWTVGLLIIVSAACYLSRKCLSHTLYLPLVELHFLLLLFASRAASDKSQLLKRLFWGCNQKIWQPNHLLSFCAFDWVSIFFYTPAINNISVDMRPVKIQPTAVQL